MEIAMQGLMGFRNKSYDEALHLFEQTLKGKIISLSFVKVSSGCSEVVDFEFSDQSKLRLTKFISNFNTVNYHLKKVS